MSEKEIIRAILKQRGWSQQRLAEAVNERCNMGWKQSNITGMLTGNTTGIRVDNLYKIFAALGCEIIVRDTMNGDKEERIVMTDNK